MRKRGKEREGESKRERQKVRGSDNDRLREKVREKMKRGETERK